MDGKFLIVDDEKSLRFTFSSFLSAAGYTVDTAQTYEEALAKAIDSDVDVIIADILLGGKTGIELLGALRARGISCPVIMVTGFPSVETATEAVRLGAYDYLPKPVVKKDLLQVAKAAYQFRQVSLQNERFKKNIEAIFRSVEDGIVMLDQAGHIVELNAAARLLCGLSDDAIGQPLASMKKDCGRECTRYFTGGAGNLLAMRGVRCECKHPDRPRQVVNLTTTPLLDARGEAMGFVLVIRDETRLESLERSLQERRQLHRIIGKSEKMQEVYHLLEDLTDVDTTVLVLGESGTGKELVVEALHHMGPRKNKPLIKINCASLPDTLLESELFGHTRGSFTGAVKDSVGRFQKANGGTIFLDEIGDISPQMQLRLLRVLQEKVIDRVGDSTPIKVDVRVVSATNCDLAEKVRRGEFREDLYYRLKVVTVQLPPLRERKADIPLLVEAALKDLCLHLNRPVERVSDEVMPIFMDYDWPGNVRELRHVLEHALVRCRGPVLGIEHLPAEFRQNCPCAVDAEESIRQALAKTGGNKAKAARLLGIDRKTLYRKLEKLDLPQC